MKYIFCILSILFCFCSSKKQNIEISVVQEESNHSIIIIGNFSKSQIYEVKFPLVYKIQKNAFNDIYLHTSKYAYNGIYRQDKGFVQGIVPYSKEIKPLNRNDFLLARSSTEYVFLTTHIPDTTSDVRDLLQPYINRMREKSKDTIHIESIQELKTTNPAFLKGFLCDDSIAIGYLTDEKRTIRYTVLPVEIR